MNTNMSTNEVMSSEIFENLKTYGNSKDTEVIDDEIENENPAHKLEEPLKKYRYIYYDNDDKEYATEMKTYEIPQEFRDFTEGLMDETHINRFGLLKAIDDYEKIMPEKKLSSSFTNKAFNFRPYQQCTIS